MISLTSSLSLKLYLNSLVYYRNIFASSSKVFGNLRQSSDTFGNFRKFSENVRDRSSGLRNNFGKFSEIFGKWSEIFGKSSKTPSSVLLYNKQSGRSRYIRTGVTRISTNENSCYDSRVTFHNKAIFSRWRTSGESWSFDLSIIFTRTGRYIIVALYISYFKIKEGFQRQLCSWVHWKRLERVWRNLVNGLIESPHRN